MHQLSTPEQFFAQLVATEPSRPFVTYYDEATGERSELSVKSLANWVAKTHFLLTDELGLGVGSVAAIDLPPHWISVPIVLGCLSAGLSLTPSTSDPAAEVAFVADPAASVSAPDVFAIEPASAAVGLQGAEPDGVLDYVVAVRPQGDAWASVGMPGVADDPCLPGLSRSEVVEAAQTVGLAAGARVLTTHDWSGPHDWIETLLAPLVAGGSVVYVRNCSDENVLERRMSQERAITRV